jgi:iron uptake system EfeUOB component EfeO/EfeM
MARKAPVRARAAAQTVMNKVNDLTESAGGVAGGIAAAVGGAAGVVAGVVESVHGGGEDRHSEMDISDEEETSGA